MVQEHGPVLGRVYTAIPAAGSAIRMGLGYSKAYVDVLGKPLLGWTVEALLKSPFVDMVTVAVRPDEVALARGEIVDKLDLSDRVNVIGGGDERWATVDKLLEAAPPERDLVLIHDGARPLVSRNLIQEVLEAGKEWGAAIAAIPVSSTPVARLRPTESAA